MRLPAYSEVGVAMAAWHSEQAGNYQRLVGDAFKEERIKARTLCDSAIAKFPGSYGAIKAAVLKAQLERPSLQLFAEEADRGATHECNETVVARCNGPSGHQRRSTL